MKINYAIAFSILLLVLLSCKKENKNNETTPVLMDFYNTTDSAGSVLSIYGNAFLSEPSKNTIIFKGAEATAFKVEKDISGQYRILLVKIPLQAKTGPLKIRIGELTSAESKDTLFILKRRKWNEMAEFIGPGRIDATSFSIGTNGYVLGGITKYNGGTVLKDFYQYNSINNQWTKKADYPGANRRCSFAFVINNKVYVGGGFVNNNNFDKDVFEYDPATNQWTKKADLPIAIYGCAYATIGTKGYAIDDNSKTLLLYDVTTNKWTVKNKLDWYYGTYPRESAAFAMNNILYYGFGYNNNYSPKNADGVRTYNETKDNWEYNAATMLPINAPTLEVRATNNVAVYNGTFYASFGDIGNVFVYNRKKEILENFISKKLGIIEHSMSFLIGSKLYATGGHSDFYAQGTKKLWMLDLDRYER